MKLYSAIPLVWCLFSLVHYFTDAPHDLKINPSSSSQPCDYPSLAVLNNASVCAVIPVVVHVIHNGEPVGQGMNVSDGLICNQIYSLRLDFRAQNADVGQVVSMYQDRVTDVGLEFYRAEIIRTALPAGYSFPLKPFEAQEISKKSDAAPIPGYQVEEVLHVWITSIYALGTECPLGSWGNPPFEDCGTDGVLVDYAWIDYQGRVLTHEVGHWLGLHHLGAPPGSLSSSCATDDGVSDTPNQKPYLVYDCFAHPQLACAPDFEPIMYQNYMQNIASIPDCKVMFTHGQGDVMKQTLLTHRPEFLRAVCE